MRKLLIAIFGSLCLLSGGAAVAADNIHSKVIYGLHEKASFPELNLTLEAKLDTGAKSASLSAYDIETFEKNDEEWVRFKLGAEHEEGREVELPIDNTVLIRMRKEEQDEEDGSTAQRRFVVKLTVCIGERAVPMRVNLADRRHFNYPLLVGSEGLRALRALVDSAEEFSAGEPRCDDVAVATE
ncbi:MAG TPA: RimK/LysX family protein [Alcanivoracaceae bacterium]|nr:RimK/LysX family protein [Alcanivoracaceae bacterium]